MDTDIEANTENSSSDNSCVSNESSGSSFNLEDIFVDNNVNIKTTENPIFRISKPDETIETDESEFASVDIEFFKNYISSDSYLSSQSSIEIVDDLNSDSDDSYSGSDSASASDEQSYSDNGSENSDVEHYNVYERVLLDLRDIDPHCMIPPYTLALFVFIALLLEKVVLEK